MATTQVDPTIKPDPRRMFGLTHDLNGQAVVRVPRTVKIGIGMPAGSDIEVYKDYDMTWVIAPGAEKPVRYPNKELAMKNYALIKKSAPVRNYPKKLSYFTFSHVGADGFEPDWDAMHQHGPKPTEIDIVFMGDDPLKAEYQMWTAAELKCHGDGVNALRVLSLAHTAEEKTLASEAAAAKNKYFPIVGGCHTCGCPYGQKTTMGAKTVAPKCKPKGLLEFQLMSCPRLGGTAYFDTTSWRSVGQLFSCLETFRTMTGRGDPTKGFLAGIPLKLVLRPFKVSVEGKPSTAYGVSLELRAETVLQLQRKLIESGLEFRKAVATAPLQIAQGNHDDSEEEDFQVDNGAAIQAEFYPDDDEGERTPEDPVGSVEAAQAVAEQRIAELSKITVSESAPPNATHDFQGDEEKAFEASDDDIPEVLGGTPNTEPIITENQANDLWIYAQQVGVSQHVLRNILARHGVTGQVETIPVAKFKPIMDAIGAQSKEELVSSPSPKLRFGKKPGAK